MKERTARRFARGWWLLTMVLLVFAVVLASLSHGEVKTDWFGVVTILIGMTAFATVGALIASRLPRNPIGWLFSLIAFGFILWGFRGSYVVYALIASPGSLPWVTFVAWLGSWIPLLAITSIPFVFLLFPDGRPPSRRWRPVAWIALGGTGLVILGNILVPGKLGGFEDEARVHIANPTGIQALHGVANGLLTVGPLAVIVAGVASLLALVLRFRRARGEERLQLRWLAYVAAATAAVLLIGIAAGLAGVDLGNVLFPAFFMLVLIGTPVASGIAILKYRLLDLDIVIKKTVVFGAVIALITAVYLGVVVLVGPGVGGGRGDVASLVATFIVVLAFQPVSRWARRLADRLVYGGRATPYEVLSGLSDRLGASYSTEDVLPRLVQIVAAGTGATQAGVWLRVGPDLRCAANWPAGPDGAAGDVRLAGDDLPPFPGMDHAFAVRHQGELLGALTVAVPASDPLTPSQEKLLNDLAAQAGLVLRNVRLVEDLRASRQRIVAAQDERAKALERNLHDGAQQQLVALAVKARLMESVIRKDPEKAIALARKVGEEAGDALENLRDLAHGIYPPLLADKGLAAALEAQARKSAFPIAVMADGVGRFPQEIESAVYFSCLEALQNVAKYAEATGAVVRVASTGGELTFEVADDGVGFDASSIRFGTGLQGMADRLDALGGAIEIRSAPGEGTTVSGRVPSASSLRPSVDLGGS
jgi:signal transduction histidine kinase